MSSTSGESSPLLPDNNFSRDPAAKKLGTRHVQIFLMFLGISIAFAVRICMSVTIVAMTDANSANPNFPEFDWDSKTNSMILSSFFWGYIVTQLPSGYIANTRSAQKLLSCGVLVSSLLNLLIPVLAVRYGWTAVVCCRVATGLTQGCLFPCVQTLMSKWVPPAERARLGSFVMNAGTFGTVITMPLTGALCASRFGWPSAFYIFGVCGIAWAVLFFYMGSDMPSEHPTICPNEMRYIDGSLGKLDKTSAESVEPPLRKARVPWWSILTSLPVWSLMIVHSGSNWGFYTLITEMPTYMRSILNFNVQKSGTISALPYLAMWILGFPISWLSDYALKRGAPAECIRKVSNTIGLWVPALMMVVLCVVKTENKAALVMILVLAVGFNAGITSGFQINHIDLSPSFAGTLISITNCTGTFFGILAPLVCGAIIEDPTNPNQWQTVFYISALVYFLTNLIFVLFGKAERQPWSEPSDPNRRFRRFSTVYEPTSVAMVVPQLK